MIVTRRFFTEPLTQIRFASQTMALASSFCMLIASFVALLAMSLALLDDSAITNNLRTSVAQGALSPAMERALSPFGHRNHQFDMFSECIGIGENLGNSDQSLAYRIAGAPYVAAPGVTSAGLVGSKPCSDLVQALEAAPRAEQSYFRFWHGYQIYLRAILSFGTLYTVHLLNAVLLYLALLYLCFKLSQWFGGMSAPLFFLTYAVFSDLLTAPLVTVHALPLAWSYFSIAYVMTLLDADKTPTLRLLLFVFASGSIFNFISMLFTPQLAPTFIAFVVVANALRESASASRPRILRDAVLMASAWFLGFAATWVMKWTLAASVLGLDEVMASLSVAASGVNYNSYDGLVGRHLPATVLAAPPYLWLLIGIALVVVITMFAVEAATRGEPKKMAREWLLMQTPLLVIIFWTETMRYHSVEHVIFAQRGLLLLFMLPLFALMFLRSGCARNRQAHV